MREEVKEYYKQVGERLKKARKAKGLTQQQASELLGITRSRVAQHEVGQNAMPHTTALKYAELYEISMDYLISGEETKNKKSPFDEFKDVEFSDEEMKAIKKYIRFIINERNEDKQ